MKKKYYALLDYDGYVAKSFYAGRNKENPEDFSECYTSLHNMEQYAINKTCNFFKVNEVEVIKIVSGHTFKKDIFPTYKAQRKNDEYLGMYRQEIKQRKDVQIAENLEADDVLVMMSEIYPTTTVVFSDDKDLHKYCPYTCKLNEDTSINALKYGKPYQLIQMISGDTIDNIRGVPNYGEKKAEKYLKENGFSLESVIGLYKKEKVSADECLKNLILVHPTSKGLLEDFDLEPQMYLVETFRNRLSLDLLDTHKQIQEVIKRLSNKVKEVYFDSES